MLVSFKQLIDIVAKLRGENGCPWDQKQTLESMVKHLAEETEEVLEAIEKGDKEHIKEELGDVLLNVVMMAQIASEAGHFDMKDIMDTVAEKVITRHTWVFGDDEASTPEEALALWKKNKAKQ